MDKILKYVKEDKIIHYIIIVAVSLIAAIPLISLRIYGTDDGFIHLLRIIGTDNTIKDRKELNICLEYFYSYLDIK